MKQWSKRACLARCMAFCRRPCGPLSVMIFLTGGIQHAQALTLSAQAFLSIFHAVPLGEAVPADAIFVLNAPAVVPPAVNYKATVGFLASSFNSYSGSGAVYCLKVVRATTKTFANICFAPGTPIPPNTSYYITPAGEYILQSGLYPSNLSGNACVRALAGTQGVNAGISCSSETHTCTRTVTVSGVTMATPMAVISIEPAGACS